MSVHDHTCMCACLGVLYWGRPWLQDTTGINKQTNEDKALIWRDLSKDDNSVYVSTHTCTYHFHLVVIYFCPSSYKCAKNTGLSWADSSYLSHWMSSVSPIGKKSLWRSVDQKDRAGHHIKAGNFGILDSVGISGNSTCAHFTHKFRI